MRVEQEITVGRPIEEVFAYLADGEALTEWMDEFAEVEKLTDGPVARGTTYRYVRKRPRTQSTWQWAEYQPHRRLEWHGPPVKVGLGRVEPRGEYTFQPVVGGTRVRAVMEPKLTGLMKVAEPIFESAARKRWAKDLARAKEIIESRSPAPAA